MPHTLPAIQHYYNSGATRSLLFRKAQLRKLRQGIQTYEARITEALYKDLHKSPEEAYATEIGVVYAEISHILQYLDDWMRPLKEPSPMVFFPSSSAVIKDPLGVCFIIAPWNYPFQLLMSPLAGAIAGGNCIVLKPSELAPHTATVIQEMISSLFEEQYITTVMGEGSAVVKETLNSFRFDHIFFTGGTQTGKAIAVRAAEQLIPVTLELGGKSPCIVDEHVAIHTAAARIVWGKFTNAGQTCVAPDYLLVHAARKEELMAALTSCISRFYGSDAATSPDYGRIINEKRFDALQAFLQQGRIITGGSTQRESLYIAPTIMDNVAVTQPVMQEEIFGPILPVFTYETNEEALAFIRQYPHPLSLYIFSKRKSVQTFFTESVSFGGGCINNTLMHVGNPYLPFGGVAASGNGQYHGKYSFDTFTRPKAVLNTATWVDPSIKYPPYQGKLKWLKRFLK